MNSKGKLLKTLLSFKSKLFVPVQSVHTKGYKYRLPPPAKYTALSDGTPEDFFNAQVHFARVASPEAQAQRLMSLLTSLKGIYIGNLVDLLEHSLQTATRALESGADEETAVCALFHDVGEVLTPACHGEVAASLLRPYISAKNDWVLGYHEIFQAYHYGEAMGIDKNIRDRFRESPHFEDCARFCQDWDQVSFDPNFKSLPLEAFEPMIQNLVRQPIYSKQDLDSTLNRAKKDLNVYDFDNWMEQAQTGNPGLLAE